MRSWTTELRSRSRQLINSFTHPKDSSPTRLRRILPVALMVIGTGMLVYVISQYGLMYHEQRRLESEWAKQNAIASESHVRNATLQTFNDGVTRVLIPKINLDVMVVEGTGRKQLNLGPGHMTETPEPGEAGNTVITGHRDTFFRHIYELSKGDNVEIRRNGKIYTYEVTGKKIVKPDDLSVLKQTPGRTMTLITCYPTYYIGPAPDRLVVFAKMAEPKNQASSDVGAAAAVTNK